LLAAAYSKVARMSTSISNISHVITHTSAPHLFTLCPHYTVLTSLTSPVSPTSLAITHITHITHHSHHSHHPHHPHHSHHSHQPHITITHITHIVHITHITSLHLLTYITSHFTAFIALIFSPLQHTSHHLLLHSLLSLFTYLTPHPRPSPLTESSSEPHLC
jgi:hypothetical protein